MSTSMRASGTAGSARLGRMRHPSLLNCHATSEPSRTDLRAGPSAGLFAANAEGLPRQSGPAAGRRRGLLFAAVHRAAVDAGGGGAVAGDRSGRAAGHRRPLSGMAGAGTVQDHRDVIGWVLLVTMLFFSSLAFTVLENAMCVIFKHRVAIRRRRYLVSAVLPYCYILALCVGMLLVTLVAGSLQVLGQDQVQLFGRAWSLHGVSGVLLYLLGLGGEILVLSSIYLVMPVGRLSLSHALIGGVTAALLWEVARHVLVWYFSTLSQVNVVYGSMTTAIVVMFSLEIGATLLLFGAQVISEFERAGRDQQERVAQPMTTPPVPIRK